MKQIIPFRKDISFNTRIGEITSISLEHSLKLEEADHVAGEFIVSGDYRITDVSVNREPFSYNIPFDITLDTKYKTDNLKIDIDDFYYEITNNQVLNVNIDVLIDGIELLNEFNIEKESEPVNNNFEESQTPIKEEGDDRMQVDEPKSYDIVEDDDREISNLFKEIETPPIDVSVKDMTPSEDKIKSLFDSFDDKNETFTTYHVHIVREDDTIDTIVAKYKTTKEEIALYNKIDELKLGDKIVIPASHNE